MEQLYRISSNYYREFESFRAYGGIRSLEFWFLILHLIPLTWFVYGLIYKINPEIEITDSANFVMVMIFELFVLLYIEIYKTSMHQAVAGYDNDINDVKKGIINEEFNTNENNYSELIVHIKLLLENDEGLKSKELFGGRVLDFFFSNESKQRVTALFIFLCSMMFILLARTNIEIVYSLFSIYKENGLSGMLVIYLSIGLLFILFVLLVYVVLFLIKQAAVYLVLFFYSGEIRSKSVIDYLIKDLNKYAVYSTENNR